MKSLAASHISHIAKTHLPTAVLKQPEMTMCLGEFGEGWEEGISDLYLELNLFYGHHKCLKKKPNK